METHVMRGNCRYSEILFGAIMATIPYPESILELGCGIGRNLFMWRKAKKKTGIDPYIYNIIDAKKCYPDCDFIYGDHRALNKIDRKYDLAFTCSVLDHIEDWKPALTGLIKSAETIILFEPYIKNEERKANPEETFRHEDTWYHEYIEYLDKAVYKIMPFPMYDINSGPYFHMIVVK